MENSINNINLEQLLNLSFRKTMKKNVYTSSRILSFIIFTLYMKLKAWWIISFQFRWTCYSAARLIVARACPRRDSYPGRQLSRELPAIISPGLAHCRVRRRSEREAFSASKAWIKVPAVVLRPAKSHSSTIIFDGMWFLRRHKMLPRNETGDSRN